MVQNKEYNKKKPSNNENSLIKLPVSLSRGEKSGQIDWF